MEDGMVGPPTKAGPLGMHPRIEIRQASAEALVLRRLFPANI